MSKPEVVLVTGSRDWQDWNEIASLLSVHPANTILIHGGCNGADRAFAYEAKKRGFVIWELPYFEDESGNEARNDSMTAVAATLKLSGHKVTCYALPMANSRGTWKAVRLMQRRGLEVFGAGRKTIGRVG